MGEPDVIAPASAESPILPTAAPATNTEDDPALMLATCGAQGGSGGNGCDTVGSPTLHINMPLANTVLCEGVSKVVVATQPCPVLT